jgi:V/A-type H+-transporting ATPase subunit A
LYDLKAWYSDRVSANFPGLTAEAMSLLQREAELLEIIQLVGPDALAESERAVLVVARMIRENFLQQAAYHPIDRYCPIGKARWMLEAILEFYHQFRAAIEKGMHTEQLNTLPVTDELNRMKDFEPEEAEAQINKLMDRVRFSFAELGVG